MRYAHNELMFRHNLLNNKLIKPNSPRVSTRQSSRNYRSSEQYCGASTDVPSMSNAMNSVSLDRPLTQGGNLNLPIPISLQNIYKT